MAAPKNPYTKRVSLLYFPLKILGITICNAKVIPLPIPHKTPIGSRDIPPLVKIFISKRQPVIQAKIKNADFKDMRSLKINAL